MDCVFETTHLKIRKFVPTDAQALYEHHLEEEVRKWIPNESYANLQEAQNAVRFYADCVNQKCLPYVLAVELKETGELVGDIGINPVAGKSAEVEIGYAICNRYSGKGYATELVHAMAQYAVSAFGIRVLFGRVLRGNHASLSVLEKNGFVFVAQQIGAEDDPYGNGMLVYKKEY